MTPPGENPLASVPTSITVELVRGCNLECTMCLRSGHRRMQLIDRGMADLVIEQIKDLGISWLRFCGEGEPTLHPELPEFVRLSREAGLPVVGMVTNGTRLLPPLVERLREAGLNFLAVSLDAACESTYRRIRRGMFSLGSIEANLEHVLRLREQTNWPLDVQVNYVVQPENVAEVNQFMRRWSGRVDRVNLLRLTSQSALRSEALGTLAPCYMARTKLYVSVNGGIYPCFRTSLPIEPLGRLRDVSIGEVWRRRRAAAAADATSLLTPLCHRCTYNPEPWEPMMGKRL